MIIENIVLFMQKVMLFTSYINNQSSFPKPLSADEEKELLVRVEKGDVESKNELINRNLRLVAHIVKKFKQSEECDDLISVGCLGLIKAINTFNTDKNIKLATYASRCIDNEILMYLRKNKKRRADVSLDESLSFDKEGNELTLEDVLGTDSDIVTKPLEEDSMKKIMIEEINKLNKRDKEIMIRRYGLDGKDELTQKEVASLLGISQSYISRIEKKVIKEISEIIKI
jgi:RNA polymerase sporulation-specific sigma factor